MHAQEPEGLDHNLSGPSGAWGWLGGWHWVALADSSGSLSGGFRTVLKAVVYLSSLKPLIRVITELGHWQSEAPMVHATLAADVLGKHVHGEGPCPGTDAQ